MSSPYEQPWRQDEDRGTSWVPSYQRKPLPSQPPPPPRPPGEEDDRGSGITGRGDFYNRSGVEAKPCFLCKKPIRDGEEWIAIGDKGQRDVRQLAHPRFNSRSPWEFYHEICVKEIAGHAKNHPDCTRPHGPCTDWHLRGKCKRKTDCGHCHFHHPELKEKYPELPKDGVLRRPQRRERLAMLKKAYEDELKQFLEGDEVLPDFLKGLVADFPNVEAMIKDELLPPEQAEILEKWKNLSEAHGIACLWKNFAEELQKTLTAQSATVDPRMLVRRFFNCADGFQEVVEQLLPRQGVRLDDDVLAFLNTSSDLEELVERMEEITTL